MVQKVPYLMSPKVCDDLVPSHIPCQHLANFLINQGKCIDSLVCLQPSSPLRSVEDLKTGVEKFLHTELDFLVSVTSVDPHYFHWALTNKDNDDWHMYFENKYMKERPLLPNIYRPNGSIKIASLKKLRELGHFFGSNLGIIETPEERSVHVGTQFDFELCEFILRKQLT